MSDTQVEAEPWANRIVEYAAAVDPATLAARIPDHVPGFGNVLRHTPEGTRVTVPGAR